MSGLENKVIRKKKLDKELTLKVIRSEMGERIFVEFSSKDGKLILQKSFQDNHYGHKEAKIFEESLKSIDDLRARLLKGR